MDKKVYLELEEHGSPDEDDKKSIKNYARPNGVYISYSKRHDRVFINFVDIDPIDRYGCEWEQTQQCLMFTDSELQEFIKQLQEIKNV